MGNDDCILKHSPGPRMLMRVSNGAETPDLPVTLQHASGGILIRKPLAFCSVCPTAFTQASMVLGDSSP